MKKIMERKNRKLCGVTKVADSSRHQTDWLENHDTVLYLKGISGQRLVQCWKKYLLYITIIITCL